MPNRREVGLGEFKPRDCPELWRLTDHANGLAVLNPMLNNPDHPLHQAVVNLLFPKQLQAGATEVTAHLPKRAADGWSLTVISGANWLELEGWADQPDSGLPVLLEVSEYNAKLNAVGGTQLFYRNLQYQFGRMNYPVLYGQNKPSALGFYIHRLGRVPVALLAEPYHRLRDAILGLKGLSVDDAFSSLPNFSYGVSVFGHDQAELINPQYHAVMKQLDQKFNMMNRSQRETDYPKLLTQVFSLS